MTIDELLTTEVPCPGARSGSVAIKDATAADLLAAINVISERHEVVIDPRAPDSELIATLRRLRTKVNRYGAHSVSDLPVRWIVEVLA